MQKEEGKFLWTAKTPTKAKKFIDSYLEKKGVDVPKRPKSSHKKSKSKRKKIPKAPLPGEPGF
jgi:hypothetical protein